MYSYFKLAYIAKLYLAIIISAGFTARVYNWNIDKRLAINNLQKLLFWNFCLPESMVFTKFYRYVNLMLYSMYNWFKQLFIWKL